MNEILTRRRGIIAAQSKTPSPVPIPSEYQEVAWIESSAIGIIETTLKFPKTALTIKGKAEVVVNARTQYLFADRDTNGVRLCINFESDNKIRAFSGLAVFTDALSNGTHILEFEESISQPAQTGTSTVAGTIAFSGKIDGVAFSDSDAGQIRSFGNNNIVFWNNASTTQFGDYRVNGKYIGRWDVYSDNSLCYQFVPCYRKSDTVVGLYEIITETFFTATGTWTRGTDV